MHPIPADISSARRENTNENEEKCLTIFCLWNTDEQKGWVFSRESYSCWAQAEYITELHGPKSILSRYVHIQFTYWAGALLVPLPSAFAFSPKEKSYLRQAGEGLRKWDVYPLSLLFAKVSSWFGGERGTHLPKPRGTGFTCGTSSVIMGRQSGI